MVLKLGLAFDICGEEGSFQRCNFELDLCQDLADASDVAVESFVITHLEPGSIIVSLDIVPSTSGYGPMPVETATKLRNQFFDDTALLRRGLLTKHLVDISDPVQKSHGNAGGHYVTHQIEQQKTQLSMLQHKVHQLMNTFTP
jgi:hypothetical protein